MAGNTKVAMNLSNSIIGVSILAMPFCMKMCGICLGFLMLIFSALLTRFTCHLLLKSAVVSRRKSFELLAFHTFGQFGKLVAELNIIGFMLGILISFFVVIGDLGPAILSKALEIQNTQSLRTIILVCLGFGAALPLGMLKELDSLARISTMSIVFYIILTMKTISEALPVLLSGGWSEEIVLWEPSGILQSLPIFSLALSCQTQIFEIYDSLPDPSLKHMNSVVKIAVYLCTSLYLLVGMFGYVANYDKSFTGNILLSFSPGMATEIIKLFFVFAVAMSFPLVIFPCRTSIHSLLYRRIGVPFDVGGAGIPQSRFKIITFVIVCFTLLLGILCPNIEMVLGFIGSTIGIFTCIIFPAFMFIRVVSKHTFERWGAQLVLVVGVVLLACCTWVNVSPAGSGGVALAAHPRNDVINLLPEKSKTAGGYEVELKVGAVPFSKESRQIAPNDQGGADIKPGHNPKMKDTVLCLEGSDACNVTGDKTLKNVYTSTKFPAEKISQLSVKLEQKLVPEQADENPKRQEPPIPQEPEDNNEENARLEKQVPQEMPKMDTGQKVGNEIELKLENKNVETVKKLEDSGKMALQQQEQILRKLEEQQKQQKILLDEQREILKELKAHERSHDNKEEPQLIEKKNNDVVDLAAKKMQDEQAFNKNDGAFQPDVKVQQVAADVVDRKPASNIRPRIDHSVPKEVPLENGGPKVRTIDSLPEVLGQNDETKPKVRIPVSPRKQDRDDLAGTKKRGPVFQISNADPIGRSDVKNEAPALLPPEGNLQIPTAKATPVSGMIPRRMVKDMVADLVLKEGRSHGNHIAGSEPKAKQHSAASVPDALPKSWMTDAKGFPGSLVDDSLSEKKIGVTVLPAQSAGRGELHILGTGETVRIQGEIQEEQPNVPEEHFGGKKVGRDLKNEVEPEIGADAMDRTQAHLRSTSQLSVPLSLTNGAHTMRGAGPSLNKDLELATK